MRSRTGSTGLEARGLIVREKDPADGRIVLARLTEAGMAKVEAAVSDHAANESELVSGLAPRERASLERMLRTLRESLPER